MTAHPDRTLRVRDSPAGTFVQRLEEYAAACNAADKSCCSMAASRALLNTHERPHPVRTFRVAQASKRLGLDLPDPLAAQVALPGDLSERVLAIVADPEPHADDVLLVWRQGL